MGIRIYKKLGWGLNNLEENDLRINWKIATDELYDLEAKNYLEYLHKLREEDQQKEIREQDISLVLEISVIERTFHDRRIYEDACLNENINKDVELILRQNCKNLEINSAIESGGDDGLRLSNVFHIMPLIMGFKWERYADAIDYAEHNIKHGSENSYLTRKAEFLPIAPWPYDAYYMDKRTGESIGDGGNKINLFTKLKNTNYFEKPRPDKVTQELVGMNVQEALENIVSEVPKEIRRLLEWTNIFDDKDAWKDLRPMLYTHWG